MRQKSFRLRAQLQMELVESRLKMLLQKPKEKAVVHSIWVDKLRALA